MAAKYQIQSEENFASWSFRCIIIISMYFAKSNGLTD